jgi:hypothetical protein
MLTGATHRFRLGFSKTVVRIIFLALVLLPLWRVYANSRLEDNTWVVVYPTTGSYEVGDTIAVEVWVEDVTNFYGADIRLAFNPNLLQVQDADPNMPGVQVQPRPDILSPDFVIRREADNVAGTVWYAATQVNPTPPASGSGALFSFSFQTIAEGLAEVTVTSYQLADASGTGIPAQASGAVYQIGDVLTPTSTATGTATATLTPSPMPTGTATATATATTTATHTPTPTLVTSTSTPTPTPTSTITVTPTSGPAMDAALRILPAIGSYALGDTFLVEVWLEDVVDLYAVDIQLAFPPEKLQVVDAAPTLPGVQIVPRNDLLWPDLLIRREADNLAGTVWYAATQLNPREPVSGSGALFAFTFAVVGEGTAEVVLLEMILATRDGDVIPAEVFEATYELRDDTTKLFLPIILQGP